MIAERSSYRVPTWAVILVAAVHMLFAGTLAMQTPYRTSGILLNQRDNTGRPAEVKDIGAPDERQHANYVGRLLKGEGLPVFDPSDPNLYETYQSHQPPLYYILATGWGKVLGVSDVEANGDGIKLRFLNVLIGGLIVLGVFNLIRWAYEDDRAALFGAIFAGLLPMQAALDGSISNDPLLICLCTWALAFSARAMRAHWCWGSAPRVALLIGLAILTKTTGVALLVALPLFVFLNKEARPTPAQMGAMAGILAVLVLPWWARNQTLYGDPLAMGAFNKAFVGSPQASVFIDSLGAPVYWIQWVGWWTARSFVGVFGYMDIWLSNTGTRTGAGGLYIAALLLLGLGKLGWYGSLKGQDSADRRSSIALCVFGVVVVVLFLKFNVQYFQAQARYILPAIGPIFAIIGYGSLRVWKARPLVLPVAIATVLALAGVYTLTKLPGEFEKRVTHSAF